MTDRNRDLEQRGSNNPGNQQTENRGTSPRETDLGTPNRNQDEGRNEGIGNESGDRNRGQGNVGSSREGNRPGNMEGNEDLSNR